MPTLRARCLSAEFDKCAQLESWWHRTCKECARNGIDIAVVCPHPGAILGREAHARNAIVREHSATLDFRTGGRHSRAPRILIAEPEADMQAVYRHYFGLQGAEAAVVGSPGECLQRVFDAESPGFDAIVLDLHPRSAAAGLEAARKIREWLPGRRLVITSTATDAIEPEQAGVSREDMLPQAVHVFRAAGAGNAFFFLLLFARPPRGTIEQKRLERKRQRRDVVAHDRAVERRDYAFLHGPLFQHPRDYR